MDDFTGAPHGPSSFSPVDHAVFNSIENGYDAWSSETMSSSSNEVLADEPRGRKRMKGQSQVGRIAIRGFDGANETPSGSKRRHDEISDPGSEHHNDFPGKPKIIFDQEISLPFCARGMADELRSSWPKVPWDLKVTA